ncbi:MAG: 2-amino-4-hydroxy-6-hydroxymethyldihydropteridine diphosphokinase [Legionella sp. 21-45-4]|nr:MAG: 2-amino-4-hydroxy-6-hydroxymethyldihydropteridine diphosphokinase [Legionella sp. 21-45-4]
MSNACYLGLGSNLRSPERQLHHALTALRCIPHTTIEKQSRPLFSQAMGLRAQPNYCNAVVLINTTLPPEKLLQFCQHIEASQGRVRKKRWGSRTLDIDILLYDTLEYHSPTLTLPHPQLLQRDFVLIPLLSLAPSLCLPNGHPLQGALNGLERTSVIRPKQD